MAGRDCGNRSAISPAVRAATDDDRRAADRPDLLTVLVVVVIAATSSRLAPIGETCAVKNFPVKTTTGAVAKPGYGPFPVVRDRL
jgi:hypothetical protein